MLTFCLVRLLPQAGGAAKHSTIIQQSRMAPLQNLRWPESHAVSTFKVLAESTMFLFMLLRWGGALNCILVFWHALGFNFEHLAQGCVNGVLGVATHVALPSLHLSLIPADE
jgi:hypothetical protein